MILEFRNKHGNLFLKIKGDTALQFYNIHHKNSPIFKLETKKFVGDKSTYTCLVVIEHVKIGNTSDIEIWLEPGDYIKINLIS